MSISRVSTPTLVALTVGALALYWVSEKSLRPVHGAAFKKKLEAVRLMEEAESAVMKAKKSRGIAVDAHNDPDGSGLIGPQFTLTTTDRGAQSAKRLAAHPNFAAAVTQMLLEAHIHRGDLVAVGMTGSLPGLDVAVLAACQAVGAEPITITSVGASMFGANDPNFSWLDMESVLSEARILAHRSLAASIGGGGDDGRGLSPAGRELLSEAIARNGVVDLTPASVAEGVKRRVAFYDSVAAGRGKPIRLYINVGGGVASLGGAQNANLIPAGLTRRLAPRNYPNHGVINVFGERRTPVIHLLQVERLARTYGILDEHGNSPAPGKGLLFVKYRYNLWIVGGSAILVLLANIFVLRLDLRRQMLGQPHPEKVPLT